MPTRSTSAGVRKKSRQLSRFPKKRSGAATRKKPAARPLPAARVPGALKTMSAPSGTARFAAGKALYVTAERDPARVYPCIEEVATLLGSECKIVRWNAIRILGALAPADEAHKLDAHLDAMLSFVRGGNLISAANAIQSLGFVARCRPDLRERVLAALLDVEHLSYETRECRNVALGHVLGALEGLGSDVLERPDVAAFVRRLEGNSRPAVAKKAAKLATAASKKRV